MIAKRLLHAGVCLVLGAWIGMGAVPGAAAPGVPEPTALDLSGAWRCRLDRQDVGVAQQWFSAALPEQVQLPGAITSQGLGDDVSVETPWTGQIVDRSWFDAPQYAPDRQPGNIRVPFWLTPDKYFVGPVWYQREVTIPADWAQRRIVLTLERPHWETSVWVGDRRIGSNNSLATPHRYDLTGVLAPGRQRLSIRVDNRLVIPVGYNSHSVTDHTQGNWNGIVGQMTLAAGPKIWIDDAQFYPDAAGHKVRATIRLGNLTGKPASGSLLLVVAGGDRGPLGYQRVAVSLPAEGTSVDVVCDLPPDAPRWDEFAPQRCWVQMSLEARAGGEVYFADRTGAFGLRDIGTVGTQVAVNGRPIFLRGTLECCIFPKTGHPPTDAASWRRIVGVCKAHGLNHMRFHSWCPPRAAFEAADDLGLYLYVECPSWANSDSKVGDGLPVDAWLYQESDRMLREYGNHPSFILMSYGNEPGGKNQKKYLGDLVASWKKKDPRRLYTSGAGWPAIPENQWHCLPQPRIQGWGQGLKSRINARPPETMTDYRDFVAKYDVPLVSHEIGQWCVYPNFAEIPKYTGPLKAKNFEIFRDSLSAHHLGDLAKDFLMASGRLQVLCYKEEIESALRTPGFGGFELLDLHDFPGQGTALVGVLDPFWDSKGYVTPAEFSRFCGPTVPLARLSKRLWTSDETFNAAVDVAHFGPTDLPQASAHWTLVDADGDVVATGKLPPGALARGTLTRLGEITCALGEVRQAEALKLVVRIDGTPHENDWDLWVYPPAAAVPSDSPVTVVKALDDAAVAALAQGKPVLLLPPPERIRGDALGRIPPGFSSIFWNTAWTRRQPPHTLGILCDPAHPALAGFPTDYHSNWQWWELVTRAHPFLIDGLPPDLRPTVQLIDDWFTNRRLGLIFEAQVGGGRLLACGIDLQSDLPQRHAARQLLASLTAYMAGDQFRPRVQLTVEQVRGLLEP